MYIYEDLNKAWKELTFSENEEVAKRELKKREKQFLQESNYHIPSSHEKAFQIIMKAIRNKELFYSDFQERYRDTLTDLVKNNPKAIIFINLLLASELDKANRYVKNKDTKGLQESIKAIEHLTFLGADLSGRRKDTALFYEYSKKDELYEKEVSESELKETVTNLLSDELEEKGLSADIKKTIALISAGADIQTLKKRDLYQPLQKIINRFYESLLNDRKCHRISDDVFIQFIKPNVPGMISNKINEYVANELLDYKEIYKSSPEFLKKYSGDSKNDDKANKLRLMLALRVFITNELQRFEKNDYLMEVSSKPQMYIALREQIEDAFKNKNVSKLNDFIHKTALISYHNRSRTRAKTLNFLSLGYRGNPVTSWNNFVDFVNQNKDYFSTLKEPVKKLVSSMKSNITEKYESEYETMRNQKWADTIRTGMSK